MAPPNPEFKKDLLRSTYTHSRKSSLDTTAVRKVFVRGITENDSLGDVVQLFINETAGVPPILQNIFHPYEAGLSLERTSITRLGKDTAMITARYRRWSGDLQSEQVRVSFRLATEAVEVYKSNVSYTSATEYTLAFDQYGLPDGDLFLPVEQFEDINVRPRPEEFPASTVKLYVGWNTDTPPTTAFDSYIDYIHGAIGDDTVQPINIGGYIWQPGEIRFDGWEMDDDVVFAPDGTESHNYSFDFTFSIRSGGHAKHDLWWDSQYTAPPRWRVATIPSGPLKDFSTDFAFLSIP